MSLLIEPQHTALQDISRDTLFAEELVCFQYKNGYRFSIDAVLVAHFLELRQNERLLDLGTGSGIISMILLYRWRDRIQEISGIEVQQGLAALARRNFTANTFCQAGKIIEGDIKKINDLIEPEAYDKVVCNPPFYDPASGRMNKNVQSQLARHQILATLQDFLEAASYAVKNGGLVSFIYPAERIGDFLVLAKKHQLEAKKLQFVYSYPQKDTAARLVLIQCAKNGGPGAEVLPPFYIYCQKHGAYSQEMKILYTKNQDVPLRCNN